MRTTNNGTIVYAAKLQSKELRDVLVDNQGIAPGRIKRVENGFWKTNVLIYLSALAGSRTIGTLPRKKICSETKSRPLEKDSNTDTPPYFYNNSLV